MTQVYFVRHGHSQSQADKIFASLDESDTLSKRGVKQVEKTATLFADKTIAALITSPLPRARLTAEKIAEVVGLPVQTDSGFHEVEVGNFSGERVSDATREAWNDFVSHWDAGNISKEFPKGDSQTTLWQRVRQSMITLLEDHEGEEVVIVTHGGTLNYTIQNLCPDVDLQACRDTLIQNGSVTSINFTLVDGEPVGTLLEWAEADHLRP